MSFQILPLKEFLVRPTLPPALSRLTEIAHNMVWTWQRDLRALFRRLDPPLWRACHRNPVLLLGRISQKTLERAAADSRYLLQYQMACGMYDAYLQGGGTAGREGMQVAYFSMEYGLLECLSIYSGGLGILSGDHLKSASDASIPLVGVGLLYQKGYFQQHLTADGWQTEQNPVNDFYTWPVAPVVDGQGNELRVSVNLPTGTVWLRVWRMQVGRTPLYLLDSNIAENEQPEHRDITDELYGGDAHTRIRQEIVLGIGGLRALQAMGIRPTVYHMNEGHSAFLAIERVRLLMRDHGLSFDEALAAARTSHVFTTHTSVPAGIDLFDTGLIHEYFHGYCREANIPFDRLLSLGRMNPADHGERFSMAVLAISASSFRNAVSRLHATVSQEMFQGLWPKLPVWEVPVTPVTNGVHLLSWLNGGLAALYDQYLDSGWRERQHDAAAWSKVAEIPARELWEARRARKRRLVEFVRERKVERARARAAPASELRQLSELLDPEALTIGFARRFATYKRATLFFRDQERVKRLLTNPQMPVQVVVAGKAHPKDEPGKQFIQSIVKLALDPALSKRIVFVEDYDIQVGREMVQGVDLWLNNPRRGEEACGTSGMKAGVNGTLNLSILDGWFDEAYEYSGGWAIGGREPYREDQDALHVNAIYSLLENEIVPMFYQGREDGVPVEWVKRIKQSLQGLSPHFNSQRMVLEYMSRLYEPAHDATVAMLGGGGYEPAQQWVRWAADIERNWERVALHNATALGDSGVQIGQTVALRAAAELGALRPQDVRVEAVVGEVAPDGTLKETTVLTLPALEQRDGRWVFGKNYIPERTGRLGFAFRIGPNHSEEPLSRPCHARLKWAGE